LALPEAVLFWEIASSSSCYRLVRVLLNEKVLFS
jgi:hypothetical protein